MQRSRNIRIWGPQISAVIFGIVYSLLVIGVAAEPLDQAMREGVYKQVTSLLVARRGEKVFERYWGEGGPNVLNDTRSATKSLTAMAFGAALDDGHIESVDTPWVSYFEAERPFRFEHPLKDAITLRDLLSMSSALDCNDDVWASPGNEEHMYPARRWTYFVLDLPLKSDYRRDDKGFGPFAYCTAGSFILGQVIERATGVAVDQYIQKRLLTPLGINRVGWGRSPSQEVQTGGGTEFTSSDLLKLGQLVLDGGRFEQRALLSSGWIDQMLTAHVDAGHGQRYGYQWWQREFVCGETLLNGWLMMGNGGNKIVLFDALDMVLVVTATRYGTAGMHAQTARLVEHYLAEYVDSCRPA